MMDRLLKLLLLDKMEHIISKRELIHPFFSIIFIVLGGSLGYWILSIIDHFYKISDTFFGNIILGIIVFSIISFYDLSIVTKIDNDNVIKGYYCKPFGFLKVTKSILKKDITNIYINQNDEKFFEIIIDDSKTQLVVFKIANRNPVLEKLEFVKTLTKC